MSGRLSPGDQAIYRALAEMLLPAGGTMPGASEAGASGAMLDRILDWRPDLAPGLMRAIGSARGVAPAEAIARLQAQDAEAFDALRLTVLGAYFLDPAVMQAIGYTGQPSSPVPPEEIPDYLAPGLLDPVQQRGPIWRGNSPTEKAI